MSRPDTFTYGTPNVSSKGVIISQSLFSASDMWVDLGCRGSCIQAHIRVNFLVEIFDFLLNIPVKVLLIWRLQCSKEWERVCA